VILAALGTIGFVVEGSWSVLPVWTHHHVAVAPPWFKPDHAPVKSWMDMADGFTASMAGGRLVVTVLARLRAKLHNNARQSEREAGLMVVW
jgi:hypothetical protein